METPTRRASGVEGVRDEARSAGGAAPLRAVIAGAGIGGLTAALALHRVGVEAEVFEQAQEVRELGVGISLLPHAVKALAGLGLLPALDRAGVRTRRLVYLTRPARRSGTSRGASTRGTTCPRSASTAASSRGCCIRPSWSASGPTASTPATG